MIDSERYNYGEKDCIFCGKDTSMSNSLRFRIVKLL